MPKPSTIGDGTAELEDNLLDLTALVKFALFQIEHSEADEFAKFKSEWCTMLYLIKEKIDSAHETAGEMGVMARAMPGNAYPPH